MNIFILMVMINQQIMIIILMILRVQQSKFKKWIKSKNSLILMIKFNKKFNYQYSISKNNKNISKSNKMRKMKTIKQQI